MNIVWTKLECPLCEMTKTFLNQRNIPYDERNINQGWTREQLLDAVPTAKTLPQIIIDGKYIGTYTDLKNYYYVQKKLEAKQTVKSLKIDNVTPKKILEIGCGLGFLTKELIDQGHYVLAVDDKNYLPNKDYLEQLEKFKVPRQHFYFKIPYAKHIDENIKMFDTLKNYSTFQYDYILWQGNCLYQEKKVTLECTQILIKNIVDLLNNNGVFVMGYNQTNGNVREIEFESTESYSWLKPCLADDYNDCMGYYTWVITKLGFSRPVNQYT